MKKRYYEFTAAAMLLAIGIVLPFFTGQIPQIGSMLLPMHIPVLLCGFIGGWKYGLIVGFILPLLRSLLFGMPTIYPNATAMAFELGTYGLLSGLLYTKAPWQCVKMLYRCMVAAMLGGRIVWGVVMAMLLGWGNFTFAMFLAGAFLEAIPGIVLQLIIIPAVMLTLDKTHLVSFRKPKQEIASNKHTA
ncbi:MAG: ECF transporter S component [Lachnospiraceae bacterium]|nr:ECF transporter S component [Lachnospiraceae bacterium]